MLSASCSVTVVVLLLTVRQRGCLFKKEGFSRGTYPESRFWSWSITLTFREHPRLPGLRLSPSSPAMHSASCSVTVVVLLITVRRTNADSVTQTEGPVILSEGSPLTLNCNYETSYSMSLFWYVQYLHQGPQLLLKSATENQRVEHQGFHATLVKKDSSFHLHKSSLQLSDSAVYYCALEDRGSGVAGNQLTFGKGTKLSVTPNITDPQPAVYQLRSSDSKSSKLSMCLLTDFDSQTNVSQRTESETVFTSHTVLNMKSLDSKSYGALAWSQNSRLSCQDAFSNHTFVSSSDASCDAKLVEKSFETDMNLNFQNLSVIGLRLLLLKVAGFNLLMTLRLWSS